MYVYVYVLRSKIGVTVHESREDAEFAAKHLKERYGIKTAFSKHVVVREKLQEEAL